MATPLAEQLIHLEWGDNSALRLLLTGGDKLHRSPSRPLPFALYNNYGPTEATVVATSGRVAFDGREPSIGCPILNVEAHILDSEMRPVSPGTVGELFIGGAGVARGYVNNPELTASRFLPDPFSTRSGARMYRTGDLVYQRSDGEIGFCGRVDDQIKVRGFRVEPNEVIAWLDRHSAVLASTVCAHEDPSGERTLAAYLVFNDTEDASATQLREFLQEHLPDYMVPSLFIRINSLPVTPNGKVDLHALPLPDSSNVVRDDFVEANTAVEQQLLALLRPLLGIGDISLNDNFFLLGGHSLLGAQLLTKVRDTFGVELTLIKLFENPTVADMAAEIERLTFRQHAGAVKHS